MLGPEEAPAAGAENAGAAAPFLLIGDHAGRAVPARLSDLGLAPEIFETHIACDHGVKGLGLRLASELRACFIHQRYSRLVIDCNRPPGAADSIPAISDGVVIPGNDRGDEATPQARRRAIFDPYHARIEGELEARSAKGRSTVLVSLHSFTPVFQGFARPWRFGVLHRGDSPFSAAMLTLLRETLGEEVGENEPYAMDDTDYTVPAHRQGRTVDYLELEVRQDVIATTGDQATVAGWIGRLLGKASHLAGAACSGGNAER